jgi:polyphosphate kinase
VSEPNLSRMEPLKKIVEATDLLNRELSWLEFNARVLHEAEDPANPLLERLKFIAIFDSNLDEFFMKRVGGLKQQLASNVRELDPGTDGTPLQQLAAINAKARPMVARQRRLLNHELLPALRQHGLEMLSWDELRAGERRQLCEEFDRQFFPVLTPLAVDPAHPFPFISNVSLSLAVSIKAPGDAAPRFARVKAPHILPRWVQVPKTLRFVPLEEVIAHNLDRLFPGMEVVESYPFRVTRNADVQRNEETAEDLLEAIQEELRERRFATVVRLEVARGMPRWMLELLFEELEIVESEVYEVEGPLALRDLMSLAGSVPLPSLRYRPWTPATHPRFSHYEDEETGVSGGVFGGVSGGVFGAIAAGDILVHHPYDSFATSVQRFIEAAADDPAVFAIKQTLYRTSAESPNMQALIRAAEARKQIAVTVEIKARFDEAANIEWAEALEGVGAHVCYGVVGLKTHAKIALVVRQEKEALRSYVHVATGNYNPETAKLYTDLGLFTADQEIAQDVAQLFNMLTGFVYQPQFKKLLVAPAGMRQRFLEMIAREVEHQRAGRGGHIIAKMNALDDRPMIDALYEASAAGVEIDLIVRGICRLRPGLPGKSETIRVISIVGRLLEHARIFYFANGGDPEYFIGSADWMTRNLDARVEAAVPIEDPRLREEIKAILDLQLADDCKAWDMRSDGSYHQRRPASGAEARCSQDVLMQRALERSGR